MNFLLLLLVYGIGAEIVSAASERSLDETYSVKERSLNGDYLGYLYHILDIAVVLAAIFLIFRATALGFSLGLIALNLRAVKNFCLLIEKTLPRKFERVLSFATAIGYLAILYTGGW